MKRIIKILIVFLSLSFVTSCKQKDAIDKKSKTQTKKNTTINNCKSLLIIAEDRSGSTTDHRKLTAQDYKKLLTQFLKNYSGQVVVRIIGNPAPEEREFFTLTIEPQKEYVKISKDAKMSIKGKLRKENANITEVNKEIIANNKKAIENFITSKVTQHVLNYKPYKGRDLTNIKDALNHIETKIKEPTFKSYDKIQVLIISDGKHDATKLKEKLQFEPTQNLDLFLIGWKDKSVFNKVTNIDSFESIDGFITYYKTLKCK